MSGCFHQNENDPKHLMSAINSQHCLAEVIVKAFGGVEKAVKVCWARHAAGLIRKKEIMNNENINPYILIQMIQRKAPIQMIHRKGPHSDTAISHDS